MVSIMSSGTVSMREPVCLIENDKYGNLRVLPQAVEILKQIDQPVVVVAIVGLYRTGKSYLANKLAGKRKGFALGSTTHSKTKGIWMWCLPHPKKANHTLVLLDTEGLGDVEKGGTKNDNWVFSLAVLLSSTLVYNSLGTIDNDALQRLHYVTELTEHIKVKSQGEDESTEFVHFFPSFVWAVRDFTLELVCDGEQITADQYLELALKLKSGHGKQTVEYNMVRECLRNYFPTRKCFVFDRPTNSEKMRHMDYLSDEDLDPSFVEQARHFCNHIMNESKTKYMKGGYNMTGRMLGTLAMMYVDTISSGQIPCLENAVVALAQIESSNAVAVASIMSSGTVSMREPVCLIENDKDGNLRVMPQAVEILKQIDQPVVVVAIVGLYRTGKSYLANKLAGKRKGFALGSTTQSKTKGIWMWCLPHPKKANHTLVLLDTEGLGDVEKGDTKNDNWVFSLAVLLSSTLVYNSFGTIDNHALQQLHYVTELTEHIKVKSQGEDESTEFVRFFPSFVWAVRDFTLELVCDGEQITADQYLELALKLKSGHGKQTVQYNMVRECLRNYFPTRKCFVFDRPTNSEKMRHMDYLSDEDLDPSFVEQARHFCNHIMNKSKTKYMKGGYNMTGRMLGTLAKTYVDAISSGQIPCLENAVVALAQIESSNAVAVAVKFYKENMAARVAFPTETQEELSDIHDKVWRDAVKIFFDLCFMDEDQKKQLELMKQVHTEYAAICEKNVVESKKACESIIRQIFEPLEKNIASEQFMSVGGYQQYRKELQYCISKYGSAPGRGIKNEESLKEYLDKNESVGQAIMIADQSLSDAQRRQQKEKENLARIEAMERERRAAEEQRKIMEKQLRDQEQTIKENMKQLEKKMDEDRKNAVLNSNLQDVLHQLPHHGYSERHFIDVHRIALIERVTNTYAILDRLLVREVITQSGYEEIMAERTDVNRMRKILSGPMHSGGRKAKDVLYEILESQERFLMSELKELRG